MTLIASVMGEKWLYQISDMMITRDTSTPEGEAIATPLQPYPVCKIQGFSQEYFLRKTVLSKHGVLASFSGNVVKGISGLKVITRQSQMMAEEWTLQPAVDALRLHFEDDDASDVSYIISIARKRNQKFEAMTNSIQCDRRNLNGCSITLAGTGKELFLEPNFVAHLTMKTCCP